MNRGIYATASGMIGSERWLDITANNLANVSTNGFKRDGISFQESMERQLSSNGGLGAPIGSLGVGPKPGIEYTSNEVGAIASTGNPMDVAIKTPDAYFAVQTSNGVRFTRDGSFTMSPDRTLVTQSGDPVLDQNLRHITVPPGQFQIGNQGALSITNGDKPIDLGTLGLFTGTFQKTGGNLLSSNNATPSANAEVIQGSIEGSNVSAIQSMLDLIKIGRSYELQEKSIAQQDELSQKLVTTLG